MPIFLSNDESAPWFAMLDSARSMPTQRFVRERGAPHLGALARLLVLFGDNEHDLFLGVTGWGMWGMGQDYKLFKLLRRGMGESRDLIDAPGHVGSSLQDRIDLHYLVIVLLYAEWDFVLIGSDGDVVLRCTHHMEIELSTKDTRNIEALAAFLENKPIPDYDIGFQSTTWPDDF